jgi:hypothetical protein
MKGERLQISRNNENLQNDGTDDIFARPYGNSCMFAFFSIDKLRLIESLTCAIIFIV